MYMGSHVWVIFLTWQVVPALEFVLAGETAVKYQDGDPIPTSIISVWRRRLRKKGLNQSLMKFMEMFQGGLEKILNL